MSDDTPQPAPKKPMTPAERQRASRAARKKERFNTCPAKQISIMLSAEASQALEQLVFESDKSQKEIIEKLLIDAHNKESTRLTSTEAARETTESLKGMGKFKCDKSRYTLKDNSHITEVPPDCV